MLYQKVSKAFMVKIVLNTDCAHTLEDLLIWLNAKVKHICQIFLNTTLQRHVRNSLQNNVLTLFCIRNHVTV